MLDKFKHNFDIQKLPDGLEFDNTNYIIGMNVFLAELIKSDNEDDADFERFELESMLAEKVNNLDKVFSSLLDILYEHHFTVSIKTIDDFTLHLKLSAIFERCVNELDT